MSIGTNIKKIRKNKGFTQKELATKSKISRSYLADIEKDRYNPSLEVLRSICTALDVSLASILEEHPEVEKPDKDQMIDQFIDRLIEEGIINSCNNIDDSTTDMILSVVKAQVALKLKQKEGKKQ